MRPERLGSGNQSPNAEACTVYLASMRPERLGSGNDELKGVSRTAKRASMRPERLGSGNSLTNAFLEPPLSALLQ